MNFITILFRFLRQRALASMLTALAVMAGVALATSILILRTESERTFSQKETGFEIIVGAKGSPLQLVLNTMFHIGSPTGNIPYKVYDSLMQDRRIRKALPMVFGDNVQGYKVIGTNSAFFDEFEFRKGEQVQLASGNRFSVDYELVMGSEVAERTGLQAGEFVTMTHGVEDDPNAHSHGEVKIVGVLAPTGTAIDRGLYTTMETVWDVHYQEYAEQQRAAEAAMLAMEAGEHDHGDHDHSHHDHDHGDHDHSHHDHDHGDHDHSHHDHDHGDHDHSHHDHVHGDHDHSHPDHDHSHHDHDHSGHDHGDHDHSHHNHDHGDHDHGDHDHSGHDHGDHDHSHHDHDHSHHHHRPPGNIEHEIPELWRSVTAVAIKLKNPVFFDSFVRYVNDETAAQAALPIRQIDTLFSIVGNIDGILLALSYLVIIIGALSIFVSIYNSLNERKREIAILRSLGASRGTVVSLIIAEAVTVGLGGGIAGLIVSHVLFAFFGAEISKQVGVDLHFAGFYAFEFLLLAGVALLSAAVACIPAIKAYRVDVAQNLTPIS